MKNLFTHKMRGRTPLEIAGIIIVGAAAIVGLAILFGFIIMWLWNWLMPDLFGLTTLTYWQAVGLFILFKILIGGCSSSGSSSDSCSSSEKSSNKGKESSKTDFSKWKHYDKFWKEEGDELYKNYKERLANPESEVTDESDSQD